MKMWTAVHILARRCACYCCRYYDGDYHERPAIWPDAAQNPGEKKPRRSGAEWVRLVLFGGRRAQRDRESFARLRDIQTFDAAASLQLL